MISIKKPYTLTFVALALAFLVHGWRVNAYSKQAQPSVMPDMPGMHTDALARVEDPHVVAERLADRRHSEFNHRLAGLLLVISSLFIVLADGPGKHLRFVHYVWPTCLITAGLFLVVYSDAEIWPFGALTPWHALTHNLEDLQHKLFAIILLAIGCTEIEKERGRLKAWTAWFFPAAALMGSILLLFHAHGGDMSAPDAMKSMEHIKAEHLRFAATGLGIALTSGLAETTNTSWRHVFSKVWPALLFVLGTLLIFYTE